MRKLLLILLCVPLIGFGQETGCIQGDCENGYGTYIFPNGDKYVGEWENDKRKNGQGTYIWTNGDKYFGEWKNGKLHGQGTFTWGEGDNKGDKYVGEWKEGTKHGQGTYTWNDGDKYVGEWKGGIQHGQGTFTFTDNISWTGSWVNGDQLEGHYNNENYYNPDHITGKNKFSIVKLSEFSNHIEDQQLNGNYINILIGGVEADFLFDTGVSDFMISESFLNKLKNNGAEIQELNIITELELANNEMIESREVVLFNVKVGDYIVDNLIVNVSKDGSPLLGMGFLKKFSNVEWNMKESTLKLYR